MTRKKKCWKKFTTETGLTGGYCFEGDVETTAVKLFSKVSRGYYYSCLNETLEHFERNILPELQKSQTPSQV